MSRKKKAIVRMLGTVVRLTYEPNMSGIEPDGSELESRKLLKKLEELAEKDPKNIFGVYFLRLQRRIFKHLRVSKH